MDLSKFDPRDGASRGVDVDLVVDGETVIGDDGQPVRFRIKGASDHTVHALLLRAPRKASKTPEEVLEADMRLARVAVVGWSDNFTVNGKKPEFSPAAVEDVMGNPVIRRAVLAEVFREANFMRKP